jgi:hypothetical protein
MAAPAARLWNGLRAPLPGAATILIDAALVNIAENSTFGARPAAGAVGRENSRAQVPHGQYWARQSPRRT